jgi:hypothetical protein
MQTIAETETANLVSDFESSERPPRGLPGVLERNVFVLLVFALWVVVHVLIASRGAIDSDSWYSLLAGKTIVAHGLPHRDTWTLYTLGHRYVDQEWLGHLILYGLWAASGWRLAILGVIVSFVATFGIATATARRLGASDRATALVLCVAYFAGISNSGARAQVFAYPLFAAVLALLAFDAQRPSRRVWLVLPVLVLWANIHGSVVLGAALVSLRAVTIGWGCVRARSAPRVQVVRALGLLVLPWACTLVSPYGLGLVHYYRSVLGNPTLEHVATEWGPTTLRSEPVFFVLLLVSLWLVSRGRGALTGFDRLVLLATGLLGLWAIRYMVWFAIVAAALVPLALDASWPSRRVARRVGLNLGLAIAAVGAIVVATVAMVSHGNAWFSGSYPSQAEQAVGAAVRADPSLRVFADESFSDWVMIMQPAVVGKSAFDTRFELLSKAQLTKLLDFRAELGINWQRAARGYRLLVLDPTADRMTIRLYERQGAKVLYRGPDVVVLERSAPAAR